MASCVVKNEYIGTGQRVQMGGFDMGVSGRPGDEGTLRTLLGELLAEFGSW